MKSPPIWHLMSRSGKRSKAIAKPPYAIRSLPFAFLPQFQIPARKDMVPSQVSEILAQFSRDTRKAEFLAGQQPARVPSSGVFCLAASSRWARKLQCPPPRLMHCLGTQSCNGGRFGKHFRLVRITRWTTFLVSGLLRGFRTVVSVDFLCC